jgi:predicted dehydrogenase
MLRATEGTRVRVSVLGVGSMGRVHARVFAELSEQFALMGVYDPDESAARAVASSHSVECFPHEARAIDAADLVVVASPIETHATAARRALDRGRHVLVEKPLCATAAQAVAIAEHGVVGPRVFVGHSERYNPVVVALHRLGIGSAIRALRLRRTSPLTRSGLEHAVLVSLGVHDIDLAAHLTASLMTLRDVVHLDDDRGDIVLASTHGAVAWIHVDRRARLRERTIEVDTEGGVYVGDLLAKTLTYWPRGGGSPTSAELPAEEPLAAQARAVARALHGEDSAVATGRDGANALMLAEEAALRKRSAVA